MSEFYGFRADIPNKRAIPPTQLLSSDTENIVVYLEL